MIRNLIVLILIRSLIYVNITLQKLLPSKKEIIDIKKKSEIVRKMI